MYPLAVKGSSILQGSGDAGSEGIFLPWNSRQTPLAQSHFSCSPASKVATCAQCCGIASLRAALRVQTYPLVRSRGLAVRTLHPWLYGPPPWRTGIGQRHTPHRRTLQIERCIDNCPQIIVYGTNTSRELTCLCSAGVPLEELLLLEKERQVSRKPESSGHLRLGNPHE